MATDLPRLSADAELGLGTRWTGSTHHGSTAHPRSVARIDRRHVRGRLGILTLVTQNVDFVRTQDPAKLLTWKASGWTTILWMAFGGLAILMSARLDGARTHGLIAGVVFGVLAVVGFGLAAASAPEPAQRRAGFDEHAGDRMSAQH